MSVSPVVLNKSIAIVFMYLKIWVSPQACSILITPVLPPTKERKGRPAAASIQGAHTNLDKTCNVLLSHAYGNSDQQTRAVQ